MMFVRSSPPNEWTKFNPISREISWKKSSVAAIKADADDSGDFTAGLLFDCQADKASTKTGSKM